MKNWRARLTELKQGQGLKAQLVRGVLGVGGMKLLSIPLTMGASILLARGLGPDGYGQYVFVLSLMTMLALPVGPGLGQLVTREVACYEHGEQWSLFRGLLRRSNQWVIFGSGLYIVVISLVASHYATWQTSDRWSLISLAVFIIPLFGFNALRGSALRGLRSVLFAQLPELLMRPALHLVIAAMLFAAGWLNPATALASLIVATGGGFLLGAVFLSRKLPRQVRSNVPAYSDADWGRAILPFTLLAAVGTLNSQIGVLLLGLFGSPKDVAAMQVGMSGAALVVFSLALINMVISPYIIRAHKDGDKDKLHKLSRYSARAALFVALPVGIPLIFFGEPILNLLYGREYVPAAIIPLAILSAGQLFNVACGSVGQFLSMSGYEKDTLFGQVIALAVNVILALVLIPNFGVVGAASAVTVSLVLWNLVLAGFFRKRLGFMPTAFG